MKILIILISLFSLSSLAQKSYGVDIQTIARDCVITKLGSGYQKLSPRLTQRTSMRILTTTNSNPKQSTYWPGGQHSVSISASLNFVGTTSILEAYEVYTKKISGEMKHVYTITAAPQNIVLHEPVDARKGKHYEAEMYVQTVTHKVADLVCVRL